MDLQNLIIFGLGIWRISSLFVREDGPFDVFVKLRERIGIVEDLTGTTIPDNFLGGLFSCVWCLSLWVSVIAWVAWINFPAITWNVMLVMALSTMAIVVDRIVTT